VTRFALRALLGRKLRTLLTGFAIVLGVATITGTFVLTDSISKAFDSIFSTIYRGTDAVITGKTAFDVGEDTGVEVPSFDESLLEEIRALRTVDAAVGGVGGEAQLIDDDGDVIQFGGAPNFGFSVDPTLARFNSIVLKEGDWPGPEEVAVDTGTASKKDIEPGEPIGVQAEGPVQRLRVSGLFDFSAEGNIGGATLAAFDLATAQRIFRKEGKLDQIRAAAAEGTNEAELLASINAALPPCTQVRTGEGQADEDAEGTQEFISFLQGFLIAFGGIALFVGAFVIANSLSITIAQRTREIATLRTIGASRRQVMMSVLIEAFVMGVLASITGILLGLGLAMGLFWLFEQAGFTLPNSGLLLETRTVVVALIVGVLVTMLASFRPARRATRVPPIAAVREGATLPPGRFRRYRPIGSAVTGLLGFALLAYGLFGGGLSTTQILTFMGLGALLVFIGVAFFTSQLVIPLAHMLGGPAAKVAGAPGVLARENAMRNPQRTASSAAALMIGLALVTLVGMLAASIRSSFFDAVDKIWITDYAVTAQNNYSPIPVSVSEPLRGVPSATNVVGVRAGETQFLDGTHWTTAVDPGASNVFNLEWKAGSNAVLDSLGEDGVVTDDGYAEDHELSVGSPIDVLFPSGDTKTLKVAGIFDPPEGGSPFGTITMSSATFDSYFEQPKNLFVFITMAGGESEANTAALAAALDDFPNAKLQDREEFKDNQASGLNQVLNILYVLLALSVIVSLFGIVNTLVLSVFERTREIGMLRAVGTTRWQVRAMVTLESVVTSLMGAAIGITLGIVLAALLIARVDFLVLAWPIGSLVMFAVAAVVVGIVAAVLPARRAARLNVLRALQYE
jgi:putative ABC transport system permease protein